MASMQETTLLRAIKSGAFAILLALIHCSPASNTYSFEESREGTKANVAENTVQLRRIDTSFDGIETELISAARKKADDFQKQAEQAYAFDLIGKYRLKKAAPVLLEHLEVVDVRAKSEEWPLRAFPAASALTQIGSPCLPSVFEYCRKPRTERQADLVACVLATIYKDNEVAALIVKKELTRVQSIPPRKVNVDLKPLIENLQRVISNLEMNDYANPHNWPK
ncbi:MAG: hypothetical protein ACR2FY_16870 [Pirellulaceae bacterium]